MSLMISDNSLLLKNPDTDEYLPVSIFNSGADKSMEKIAEFAEATKSEAEAVMTAKKTEISDGFREQLESQVNGVISDAKMSAEAAIEAKKNEVLGEIPDSYTELQDSVNQVKDDLSAVNNSTDAPVPAGKVWMSADNGAGWTDPQGGASMPIFELIGEINIDTEEVSSVAFSFDDDYRMLFLVDYVQVLNTSGAAMPNRRNSFWREKSGRNNILVPMYFYNENWGFSNSSFKTHAFLLEDYGDFVQLSCYSNADTVEMSYVVAGLAYAMQNGNTGAKILIAEKNLDYQGQFVKYIKLDTNNAGLKFMPGSWFKVYGIKA